MQLAPGVYSLGVRKGFHTHVGHGEPVTTNGAARLRTLLSSV